MTDGMKVGITAGILLAIFAFAVWSVVKDYRNMSETDAILFGCWTGEETNTSGEIVPVEYRFHGSNDYSINWLTSHLVMYEAGEYHSTATSDGKISVKLTPRTTPAPGKAFSLFGAERTHVLEMKSLAELSEFFEREDGSIFNRGYNCFDDELYP